MAARLLAWAVAVTIVTTGNALSRYSALFPNGNRVPCPADVDQSTCSAGTGGMLLCPGVGHATCRGGSMPNNAFGRDFALEGYTWTAALCRRDSDGDGLTNGEELGDPCCNWSQGAVSDAAYVTSHPGFASSVSASPARASSCTPSAAPPPSSGAAASPSFFNAGEVPLNLTVANPGITLRAGMFTNYWTYTFPLPFDRQYHMTGFSVMLDKVPLVHHFLVSGCKRPITAGNVKGPMETSMPDECGGFGVEKTIWVWAPGEMFYATPSTAGIRFGPGAEITGIAVQMHYSSISPSGFEPNTVDFSTFKIHYTPTLRVHNLGMIVTGSLIALPPIPPGVPEQYDSAVCVVAGLQPNVVVTSYLLHAHLLGRKIWTDKIVSRGPGNFLKVMDMGRDDMWRFDNQNVIYAPPNVTLQNGDFLSTNCVYNSTGLTVPTRGGYATYDEMCMQFTYIYPFTGEESCNQVAQTSGRLPAGVTNSLDLFNKPATGAAASNLTASGSLRVINVSCPAFPLISMSNPCIANGFNYMIDSSGNMVLVPIFSQLPSNLCGPWIAAIDRSTITAATRTVTLLVGFTQSIFTQDVNMTIAADGLTLSTLRMSLGSMFQGECTIAFAGQPIVSTSMNAGTLTRMASPAGSADSCAANACDAAGYAYIQFTSSDAVLGFALSRAAPAAGCASLILQNNGGGVGAVRGLMQSLFPAASATVRPPPPCGYWGNWGPVSHVYLSFSNIPAQLNRVSFSYGIVPGEALPSNMTLPSAATLSVLATNSSASTASACRVGYTLARTTIVMPAPSPMPPAANAYSAAVATGRTGGGLLGAALLPAALVAASVAWRM